MHEHTRKLPHHRQLLYFPIIHTLADMGALQEAVQRATVQKLGLKVWRHKQQAVDQLWTRIERILAELHLPFPRVRLYQDGLPVCGHETAIVTKLAQGGSRNHQLLMALMQQGATLMGTESAELLVQEYAAVKNHLQRPQTQSTSPGTSKSQEASVLEQRNQFIARRINDTLLPGETGILFLGMLHHIGDLLDHDIEVIYPLR